MARYYYSNSVSAFLADDETRIFGELTGQHPFQTLTPELKASWRSQITILQSSLVSFEGGHLFFEFSIPRMGKRADNILVYDDLVFVIEFKVGYAGYDKYAIDQVVDYALDLKNFHESSHNAALIPILVVTNAPPEENELKPNEDLTYEPLLANSRNLAEILRYGTTAQRGSSIEPTQWASASYKPTPTIVEAAQALYAGHTVAEIARTDADDTSNLSTTSDCIQQIIDESLLNGTKSICFVTGVPGAGKTLAGLNIAIQNMERDIRHATYMSGNGPLVQVLREALSRNRVAINKLEVEAASDPENPMARAQVRPLPLYAANDWAKTIIQAIHEFRADQMDTDEAPAERVVIFDESQRAWTREKLRSYLGPTVYPDFDQSEPQFLVGQMDKHLGFCTIVCLVGGGQEIHDGEAGLEEWFRALKTFFPDWAIYYSDKIETVDDYLRDAEIRDWLRDHGEAKSELHLDMPVRSFRSDRLAAFVESILAGDSQNAKPIYEELSEKDYPIYLTRSLESARRWLREKARGTNRTGLVASSGAGRLKPHGIFVKNKIKAADWFLKGKDDVRSSFFLEDVATEFDIQGLELDWIGVCWDGDFYFDGDQWQSQSFSGSSWKDVGVEINQRYLKNTYRVLLTRARQGMVIFVPHGNDEDATRPPNYYDGTFEFLKGIGLSEI
ncbi:MAG: DUF2075 domain-containing protein [Pyrinomonadaceae bacterium]|nr:DUF2075 domain-containing protein [Pyrinomonadaceae bacterium]MBP6213684.1 DUF2075 domain-containing protein [Pyrinomonadaceae bacterium]